MRAVFLAAVLLSATVTAVASPSSVPTQPRVYHRNPQDCADGKLEPLFMADWWYDLSAAMAEHRIDDIRQQAIENQMLALANELGKHNPDNNPALVVDFCRKLNGLRPHWSHW